MIGRVIPCPTREAMLARELPIVEVCGVPPRRVIYRFESEAQRRDFDAARARAYDGAR